MPLFKRALFQKAKIVVEEVVIPPTPYESAIASIKQFASPIQESISENYTALLEDDRLSSARVAVQEVQEAVVEFSKGRGIYILSALFLVLTLVLCLYQPAAALIAPPRDDDKVEKEEKVEKEVMVSESEAKVKALADQPPMKKVTSSRYLGDPMKVPESISMDDSMMTELTRDISVSAGSSSDDVSSSGDNSIGNEVDDESSVDECAHIDNDNNCAADVNEEEADDQSIEETHDDFLIKVANSQDQYDTFQDNDNDASVGLNLDSSEDEAESTNVDVAAVAATEKPEVSEDQHQEDTDAVAAPEEESSEDQEQAVTLEELEDTPLPTPLVDASQEKQATDDHDAVSAPEEVQIKEEKDNVNTSINISISEDDVVVDFDTRPSPSITAISQDDDAASDDGAVATPKEFEIPKQEDTIILEEETVSISSSNDTTSINNNNNPSSLSSSPKPKPKNRRSLKNRLSSSFRRVQSSNSLAGSITSISGGSSKNKMNKAKSSKAVVA